MHHSAGRLPALQCSNMNDTELIWIPDDALAHLAGVRPQTARRWRRNARTQRIPLWLTTLVATVHRGLLDALGKPWHGWRIRGNTLITPEGWTFTQGEIRPAPPRRARHFVRDWLTG